LSATRAAWLPSAGDRRLALLALARAGVSLLGLATLFLIARTLGPAELGRWSLALAVHGYVLHLGEFGLRGVVTTEAARAGSRLPELLARYLRLRLALSALVLAATLMACAVWRPGELLLVGLVAVSILPIALQLDWLALVEGRDRLAALLLLVRPTAFLAMLVLLPGASSATGLAACWLAAWLLAALASWSCLDRPAAGFAGPVPRPRTMLRRGASLALVTLSNQAQLSADLLVVGVVLGPAKAGDYYVAGQILVAGLLLANAAGQIALARLPALAGDQLGFRAEILADLRRLLCFASLAALALMAVAPAFVPRLFGAEHAGAVEPLLWLLPWFVLQHPTTVLQAALTAIGREDRVVRTNVATLVILLMGLALVATAPNLASFALTRSVAELVRVILLWRGLRMEP
jgi:O-antigen/teichoic acid export membrane protein